MPKSAHRLILAGSVLLVSVGGANRMVAAWGDAARAVQDPPPDRVSFGLDVRPLFEDLCADCHMEGARRGRFSLDSRDEMLLHESAVKVGDSEASRLIHLVRGDDPDLRMPLRGPRLTDEEVSLLAQWIDEGAPWEEEAEADAAVHPHLAPREVDLPEPHDGITHPIDLLLVPYFDEQGVTPSEVTDDAAFLRRASLDIVGLLPSVDELDAFLNDDAADKRGRAVARLLSSDDAFAAHWLTLWNDLLRNDYSGTGYIDGGRTQITAWLYGALHDNMRYDQFVRDLANPGEVSAGFSRGIRWRGEASASQRWELQFARSVGQVFLGINMKCASCHDSFVDDWKLADAYGLAAIIADEPLEMYRCDVPTGDFATPGFVFNDVGDVDPGAPKAERLSMLADLLVDESNGRTTRTIVNRIWARLMGRGLVEPVDTMAGPAWNEDLLDYLANQLVESGYDLRAIIRLIVTSVAYQCRAIAPAPDDPFTFRGPTPQRMTAEQFVDSVWMLTGSAPSSIHAPVGERFADGLAPRAALMHSTALMRSLGRPAREQIISTRPEALTTLQALDLANGDELAGYLSAGGEHLLARHVTPIELVRFTYRAALSREPSRAERDLALEFLGPNPSADQVADLLWAIVMLPEFQLVR